MVGNGEHVSCSQIFEELPHEGGNHYYVLFRGNKTMGGGLGKFPEEFGHLSSHDVIILTLRPGWLSVKFGRTAGVGGWDRWSPWPIPMWRSYGLLRNTFVTQREMCLCIYPSFSPLHLSTHYPSFCTPIHPLLGCLKTQQSYFTWN